MGSSTGVVASPLALPERPTRLAATTGELVLTQTSQTVELSRSDEGETWTLPLTGVRVQTVDRSGRGVTARATDEAGTLVVRTERRVRLPGGPEVLVETTERHVLRADGALEVTSEARSGGVVRMRQVIYERVQER
jgi:hypothetical protein